MSFLMIACIYEQISRNTVNILAFLNSQNFKLLAFLKHKIESNNLQSDAVSTIHSYFTWTIFCSTFHHVLICVWIQGLVLSISVYWPIVFLIDSINTTRWHRVVFIWKSVRLSSSIDHRHPWLLILKSNFLSLEKNIIRRDCILGNFPPTIAIQAVWILHSSRSQVQAIIEILSI